jgi:tetratricopeptide (TPR) repeat protein
MGTACWNLSRFAEAVSFAEKALRLAPDLVEAGFNKAIGLLMLGRAGEAMPIIREVLEKQPDYPPAQFMFCVTSACAGELEVSERAFRSLEATPVGPFLGNSFLDVSKRMLSASQLEYARRTIETALRYQCASDEMAALLEACRAVA